ncbi:hypothetical protein Phage2-1_00105 [Achromobacter phage 2-1]|nr:hypothetical protein Phage2-1_00105 [Achromobacter phage 2-1]
MIYLKYALVFVLSLIAYIVGMQAVLDVSWWLADNVSSFHLPYDLGGLAWSILIMMAFAILAIPIVGRVSKPKV